MLLSNTSSAFVGFSIMSIILISVSILLYSGVSFFRKASFSSKFDNSKELKHVKVKNYKHMGKIDFPLAQ